MGRHILFIPFITIALAGQVLCMLIPQDIEILDGYDFEGPPEIYPEETYFEAKALADSLLLKAIRNKRSYRILPSAGLRSHFQIDSEDKLSLLKEHNHQTSKARSPRSIESSQSQPIDTIGDVENETPPKLPTPEKQVMDSEYYTKGNWNVQTFNTDYNGQKPQNDDIDSIPDATVNEGIKSRQPRVNFITQAKKDSNGDDRNKDRLTNYMTKLSADPNKSSYDKAETRLPESYPSRSYDQYLRRYDRYDEDYTNYNSYNRYDPYEDYYLYRRRYDPYDSYSPRTPTYPDDYYVYPDRRYDVPEPREYRSMYSSNDLYERGQSYSPAYEQPPIRRRNRIIYYAHLPEVVRAPPTVDLTYRHSRDHRFDSYYPPLSNYQAGSNTNHGRGTTDFAKPEKKDYHPFEAGAKTGPRSENGRD